MLKLGTPLSGGATRLLLLGSGELGKEVVIEAQRLGVECIAVDRYADAPAMQVAHRAHVIRMLDGAEIRRIVELEKPHYIVPEIEAIDTKTLVELEKEGWTVIPTARATRLTMDREGIRRLAAEELKLPTSLYRFAASEDEYRAAVRELGMTYSSFMSGLKRAQIEIDRKVLADLAVQDKAAFAKIASQVKASLAH